MRHIRAQAMQRYIVHPAKDPEQPVRVREQIGTVVEPIEVWELAFKVIGNHGARYWNRRGTMSDELGRRGSGRPQQS